MKVYVDFDRTLFDCDSFLGDLYALINKYNITKELFRECQCQCKKKGFNPYIILDLVKEKYDFNDNLYRDVASLMKNTKKYLYSDTIPFLEYLKSLNYEVIILSKGNQEYQQEKIYNADLNSLFSKLIITMKHKGNMNLDYENSIFVDDNPTELSSIMSKNPKMLIRIQRENSLYSNVPITDTILSFKTLEEIINNKILN